MKHDSSRSVSTGISYGMKLKQLWDETEKGISDTMSSLVLSMQQYHSWGIKDRNRFFARKPAE
jgi:hypothetical protein